MSKIGLFFDTETTGFPSEDFIPEIVQIAAILQDLETRQVYAELNLIVTPMHEIPDEVAAIHGITTTIARAYGVSQNTANRAFCDLIESSDSIIAHNIAFDLEMLHSNWLSAWIMAQDRVHYDTMAKSRHIINLPPGSYHGDYTEGPKPPKLSEAYTYFTGKELTNAHDAMADTEGCRAVYFGIQEHIQ